MKLVALAVSDKEYKAAVVGLGRPQDAEGKWKTLAGRAADFEACFDALQDAMKEVTLEEATAACDKHEVPYLVTRSLDEVFEFPQVKHNGLIQERQHSLGTYSLPRHAATFGGTPVQFRRHSPAAGEHNSEVAKDFGIASLRAPAPEVGVALATRGDALAALLGRGAAS